VSSGWITASGAGLLGPRSGVYIGNEVRGWASDAIGEIVIGESAVGIGNNTTVIGKSATTNAYIYGLVRGLSGFSGPGATFGSEGVSIRETGSLRMWDSDSSNYVAFKSPATVNSNVTWTLPAIIGPPGQVLGSDGSGTLFWKPADGVTGADKQIQFNIGGSPGATAGLVLEHNTAGYSAGTLGVSGGAYFMGNVGIGITTPQIGSRIVGTNSYSGAKLEVRGDIRIPSGGFFVNKTIELPAGVSASIGANENAFVGGVFTILAGATLSIESTGSLVVL
jgi:hypothetical protein